jgi:Fe-Mn family superoxide dismutase
MLTRREAIIKTAAAGAVCATVGALPALSAEPAAPEGPFQLPPLPYPFDALEPHIDAKTMEIHHGKHHATYVANLNKAIAGHADLAKKSVEELLRDLAALPESIRTAVRNSGGGHANHSLYWQTMKKDGGGAPKGELAKAIDKQFGSYLVVSTDLVSAAIKVFGSGWAWLTLDGKQLKVESTPNQDSPLLQGRQPLLGIDVWEHAYYLKHQNRRGDYAAAFLHVINWDFVEQRYEKLMA